MLLPGTDAAGAQAVAEKARYAVAAASALGLTVSIGGAAGARLDAADLVAADAALFAAKRAGRNRTVIQSEALPSQGQRRLE